MLEPTHIKGNIVQIYSGYLGKAIFLAADDEDKDIFQKERYGAIIYTLAEFTQLKEVHSAFPKGKVLEVKKIDKTKEVYHERCESEVL